MAGNKGVRFILEQFLAELKDISLGVQGLCRVGAGDAGLFQEQQRVIMYNPSSEGRCVACPYRVQLFLHYVLILL